MKKTVLLDLDCVVADVKEGMRSAFLAETGLDIPCESWSTYYVASLYNTDIATLYRAIIDHGVLESAPALAGAREAIEILQAKGHAITICTNRSFHPRAEQITCDWLSAQGIHADSIIVNTHGHCKAEACAMVASEFAIMIDDHFDNLALSMAKSNVARGVLIDQPWNHTIEIPTKSNILRCESLISFVKENFNYTDICYT
jgi:FMN phosphatase YigB (HAD superfamily)